MFSSSVRRAAPISSNIISAAPKTASAITSSRCHQRRASSSKPSSPANGPKKLAEHEAVASAPSKQSSSKSIEKSSKKKAETVAAKSTVKGRDESMLHLPSVPSTQHITPLQLCASAFFSLHRPMSLTNGFPKTVTDEAFAAIFTPRTRSNKPSEVINTLSSTVKKLDAVTGKLEGIKLAGPQDEWKETNDLPSALSGQSFVNVAVEHLDGAPEGSQNPLQELMSGKFRPFNPPPAPMPLDTTESLAAGAEAAEALEPQHRTYTAILTIEESTDSNGETTWAAHHSPLVAEEPDQPAAPLRYIERVQTRREQYKLNRSRENEMLVISVKRQRKLKMKKHKYKKLMRRTRNLRRRLDRT